MPARSKQQEFALHNPRNRMPRMGQFGAQVANQLMTDSVMFMVGGAVGGKMISRVQDVKFVGKQVGKVRLLGKQ